MNNELTVGDLTQDADYVIGAGEPARDAKRQFDLETTRSLILIDEDSPIGVVTRGRIEHLNENELDQPVRDFCISVSALKQDQSVTAAREEIDSVDFDVDRLPVVNDQGHMVGVINRETIMREIATTHADQGSLRLPGEGNQTADIRSGMDVHGADGEKLGEVGNIAIEKDHVASFAVKHGMLGRDQKRVPADNVTSVDGDSVHVDFSETEFNFLPDIEDLDEEEARTHLTHQSPVPRETSRTDEE